ncbi:MAG: hypothetical protein ACYDIA_04265 [Candidatus Humimicrobiaceae bacterium]
MQQQNTPALQPTLEEVSAQLKHWRQIKRNHREPIPKKLWQAAAELSRQNSISSVSKALRLSYTDLKKHVYGPSESKQAKKERPSAFIELECVQPFMGAETTVEIEDFRGSKMRICFKGKPDFDLMDLVKAFQQKNL